MLRFFAAFMLLCAAYGPLVGQTTPATSSAPPTTQAPSSKWYDVLKVSGYLQMRYNRLLETNPDLNCEQCDKSWGKNNGFFFRRARFKLAGHLSERVYFYFQTDFASVASANNLHFAQIRDAYVDLGLDKKNTFRFRLGQSKIPFGFENLQSSQNRLPLDRDDALNSAMPNERDLGVLLLYSPPAMQARFAELIKSGLRGSGDYGVVALGAFNGQSSNKLESNDNLHVVARVSYPFKLRNGQFVEPGIQAYTGKFNLLSTSKNVKGTPSFLYDDRRVAASLVVYPQPFGLQAEYNIGQGPQYNPALDSIELSNLNGGYVMLHYAARIKNRVVSPFVRYQFYEGGKKQELDARRYVVRDWEFGLEWQLNKYTELNATYTISDRRFEDSARPLNHQAGNLLRLQLQVNY